MSTLSKLGLALFVALHLASCSTGSINDSDPAVLFKDAEEDIASDRYEMALEKLRTVRNKFPYSNYSVLARLRIADVYFLQETFSEAAASYETFKDLHPNHEKTAYAMFRLGESYYNDNPTNIARDQSSAKKALEAYESFLNRFPNNELTPKAKEEVKKIKNILAEKELYIGRFYEKLDKSDAAKKRYQKLVDEYPDSESAKVVNNDK